LPLAAVAVVVIIVVVVLAFLPRTAMVVIGETEGVGGGVAAMEGKIEMVDLGRRQRHAEAGGGKEEGGPDQGACLHGVLRRLMTLTPSRTNLTAA
jgi:hypothetical protein